MAWKIYNSGNYVYVENESTRESIEGGNGAVTFKRINIDSNTFLVYAEGDKETGVAISVSDMVDKNNVPYTESSFKVFKETFTGSKLINGLKAFKKTSDASLNSLVVKSSPGSLNSIIAIGLSSTVRYLKLYNKATAPIVGTDIPLMTIPVPANTQGAGISIPFSIGVNFENGISIAITSGSSDDNTTAVAAGDVIINLTYA
jgi:hypothetical protein